MSGKTAVTTCRLMIGRPMIGKAWSIASGKRHGQWVSSISKATLAWVLSLGVVLCYPAIAADPVSTASKTSLQPDLTPLDVKALQPDRAPAYVVTATRISLTQLSIPSLWWLQEQLANEETYGGNLLENWLAYPNSGSQPGRVDLVVNRQSWSLLDYLDRYAFIHAFGEAGRDYGYNVRVFDGQAALLGASTCDFSTVSIDGLQRRQFAARIRETDPLNTSPSEPSSAQPEDSIACQILLDSSGKAGLRGGSNQLLPGANGAKALGIGQP